MLQHGEPIKGISVSVWLQPERTRELILDFAFAAFDLNHPPSRAVLAEAVKAATSAAIAARAPAGWEPESRGRSFRFDVPG